MRINVFLKRRGTSAFFIATDFIVNEKIKYMSKPM